MTASLKDKKGWGIKTNHPISFSTFRALIQSGLEKYLLALLIN